MIRDVPYFPCYASNLLADKHFRMMTLKERGLWVSIYLECWPNKSVPAESKALARYLGVDQEELEAIPQEHYMHFFEKQFNEIQSPELEAYRKEVYGRRELQSQGGKKGVVNKKLKNAKGAPKGIPEGPPQGSLGYVKLDQVRSNQIKPLKGVSYSKNFDEPIEEIERKEDYLRASKG